MLSSVVIENISYLVLLSIDNWSVELSFDDDHLIANCTIGVSFLIVKKHTHVA